MQLDQFQIEQLKTYWPFDGEFQFHRRVANFVYFNSIGNSEVVLRLTEPSHRNKDEIISEMHWMDYLSRQGLRLASPLPTVNGEFVVKLEGKQEYFAAVISKAPGRLMKDQDINQGFLDLYGQYLGKMNRLTKDYRPPAHIGKRQEWRQDESLAMALRSHDKNDPIAYQRFSVFLAWLESLPQNRDCYGLIHCDLHMGNFFVKDNVITAFDFDDSCYQWFSHDLVAPMMSFEHAIADGQVPFSMEQLNSWFLDGYFKQNHLEQVWIDRLPLFKVYRDVLLYHWVKTSIRENLFDERAMAWAHGKLPVLKSRAEVEVRFI